MMGPKQDMQGWALAWVLVLSMALSVSMAGILQTGRSIYAGGRREADRVQARMTAVGLAEAMAGNLESGGSLGEALKEKAILASENGDGFSFDLLLEDGWPEELGEVGIRTAYEPESRELQVSFLVEKGGQKASAMVRAFLDEDGWSVLGYAPYGGSGEWEAEMDEDW